MGDAEQNRGRRRRQRLRSGDLVGIYDRSGIEIGPRAPEESAQSSDAILIPFVSFVSAGYRVFSGVRAF